MSNNDFTRAADVVARSGLVRTAGRAIDVLRNGARRSAVYRLAHNWRRALGTPPAAERVRLAGVVILAALLTHAAVLQWVPSVARPYAPWLRLEIAAAALALIVLAGPIARGWAHSRTRRLVARIGQTRMHA